MISCHDYMPGASHLQASSEYVIRWQAVAESLRGRLHGGQDNFCEFRYLRDVGMFRVINY